MNVENLKAFGCNTNEGIARCMNNESFYLMLVNKFISSTNLSTLEEALKRNDLETAFKEAHSIKGVAGNLSLTPLYHILVEIVEPLREKKEMDYITLFNKLTDLFNQLRSL